MTILFFLSNVYHHIWHICFENDKANLPNSDQSRSLPNPATADPLHTFVFSGWDAFKVDNAQVQPFL